MLHGEYKALIIYYNGVSIILSMILCYKKYIVSMILYIIVSIAFAKTFLTTCYFELFYFLYWLQRVIFHAFNFICIRIGINYYHEFEVFDVNFEVLVDRHFSTGILTIMYVDILVEIRVQICPFTTIANYWFKRVV